MQVGLVHFEDLPAIFSSWPSWPFHAIDDPFYNAFQSYLSGLVTLDLWHSARAFRHFALFLTLVQELCRWCDNVLQSHLFVPNPPTNRRLMVTWTFQRPAKISQHVTIIHLTLRPANALSARQLLGVLNGPVMLRLDELDDDVSSCFSTYIYHINSYHIS